MLRNTRQSWGSVAKSLHWVIALLIFSQFVLGWLAVSWHLSPTKLDLFVWHKSFGITILVLACIRIAWRLANPVPELPVEMPQWESHLAQASHFLLYFIIVAMPLSGWIINSAANIPFAVFWTIPLPDITPKNKTIEEYAELVHFSLFSLLAVVLVAHISAALRHHFIKHNNILRRMLPGRSGE